MLASIIDKLYICRFWCPSVQLEKFLSSRSTSYHILFYYLFLNRAHLGSFYRWNRINGICATFYIVTTFISKIAMSNRNSFIKQEQIYLSQIYVFFELSSSLTANQS